MSWRVNHLHRTKGVGQQPFVPKFGLRDRNHIHVILMRTKVGPHEAFRLRQTRNFYLAFVRWERLCPRPGEMVSCSPAFDPISAVPKGDSHKSNRADFRLAERHPSSTFSARKTDKLSRVFRSSQKQDEIISNCILLVPPKHARYHVEGKSLIWFSTVFRK